MNLEPIKFFLIVIIFLVVVLSLSGADREKGEHGEQQKLRLLRRKFNGNHCLYRILSVETIINMYFSNVCYIQAYKANLCCDLA